MLRRRPNGCAVVPVNAKQRKPGHLLRELRQLFDRGLVVKRHEPALQLLTAYLFGTLREEVAGIDKDRTWSMRHCILYCPRADNVGLPKEPPS